ncbi:MULTISPECIES: hypothetical protein [Microbacterium]|uniref:Uncharacterized protein n=1 Tax=Microbacterium wangchenii TaxID=2541726 RepID=A0ABX5SMZ0_9MICO|nr:MULTISPECIES: hypothetical protein [Microbacterium]MCK6066544.1 hypothetical protein [Microbacterium sp. EYE_512]QBR87494.1 hypothetical protein E4K62_01545 [Microbacterium wangchenii]TXK14823.1 hypothetical protein FVP99_14170 [Microbacterium wangchenii]
MTLALLSISDNVVSPVLGPLIGLTICAYVERGWRTDAWAHIPRRHQDSGRDEPGLWSASGKFVQLAALAGGSASYVGALGVRDVATQAGPAVVGALTALALAELGALTWDRLAPRDRRVDGAPPLIGAAFTAGVILIVSIGAVSILARSPWDQTAFLAAAGGLVAYGLVILLMRLIPKGVRCLPEKLISP